MFQRIRLHPAALAVCLCLALAPSAALAQETAPEAPPADSDAAMMEMMAAWQKAATPGPHHTEHLARYVGEWTTTSRFWVTPGEPPAVTTGTMSAEWILGGRYVHTHFTGEVMGQAFEGQGIEGYDNVRGKFTSVWIDNMSTGTMMIEGDCGDPECTTIVYRGEYADPVTGEMVDQRMVATFVDEDTYRFEGFTVTPEGEVPMMELTLERVRAEGEAATMRSE